MKELFISSSFNFINNHKNLSKYEKIKIKYGLEVMYHFITKTTVILLLSYFLGLFKQNIMLFCFYGLLRMFGNGLHAKSNLGCWVFSIITYILMGLYIKHITFNAMIIYILDILSIFSFILFAPADTKNLPIINQQKRNRLKIKTCCIAIIYIITSLLIKSIYIKSIICFSMCLEAILINPFIYKITNSTFNNYKNYSC